jgi:hypothetical protein
MCTLSDKASPCLALAHKMLSFIGVAQHAFVHLAISCEVAVTRPAAGMTSRLPNPQPIPEGKWSLLGQRIMLSALFARGPRWWAKTNAGTFALSSHLKHIQGAFLTGQHQTHKKATP